MHKKLNSKLGKLFSVLKAGYKTNESFVLIPYSDLRVSILKLLFFEGYINGFFIDSKTLKVKVYLKYYGNCPSFNFVNFNLSKLDINTKLLQLKKRKKFLFGSDQGLVVYSTSQGLKTSEQCLVEKKGGQFLFQIK